MEKQMTDTNRLLANFVLGRTGATPGALRALEQANQNPYEFLDRHQARQWVIFLSIAGHKDAVKAIRATLLTSHWVTVGIHEICLLPRTKYGTSVKALPSGIVHTAIFIKNDLDQSQTYYALTARPEPTDSDLYFTALIKHSAVPVHSNWKA